jgi:D-serine deaminase-like pyridoxal phosphate-dependent protein
MSTIQSSILADSESGTTADGSKLVVGAPINDIEAPAAIFDLAIIKKNCEAMLDAKNALGVHFRAHVKTHKVSTIWKPIEAPYI